MSTQNQISGGVSLSSPSEVYISLEELEWIVKTAARWGVNVFVTSRGYTRVIDQRRGAAAEIIAAGGPAELAVGVDPNDLLGALASSGHRAVPVAVGEDSIVVDGVRAPATRVCMPLLTKFDYKFGVVVDKDGFEKIVDVAKAVHGHRGGPVRVEVNGSDLVVAATDTDGVRAVGAIKHDYNIDYIEYGYYDIDYLNVAADMPTERVGITFSKQRVDDVPVLYVTGGYNGTHMMALTVAPTL